MYIYMYDWVTLLDSRNWHNIVNQVYFNKNKIEEFPSWLSDLTNPTRNHEVVGSIPGVA